MKTDSKTKRIKKDLVTVEIDFKQNDFSNNDIHCEPRVSQKGSRISQEKSKLK